MKTLQEAIEQIKRLDAARNGEVACDDLDSRSSTPFRT